MAPPILNSLCHVAGGRRTEVRDVTLVFGLNVIGPPILEEGQQVAAGYQGDVCAEAGRASPHPIVFGLVIVEIGIAARLHHLLFVLEMVHGVKDHPVQECRKFGVFPAGVPRVKQIVDEREYLPVLGIERFFADAVEVFPRNVSAHDSPLQQRRDKW